MSRLMSSLLVALVHSLWFFGVSGSASLCGKPSGNQPSDFDFYMLAMSYSPTFCRQHPEKSDTRQCEGQYGLILHGLWPNYERGYPQNCKSSYLPTKDDLLQTLDTISDWQTIAPEYDDLIVHEWCKHGTCSGLSPQDYLDKAFNLARQYVNPSTLNCEEITEQYPDAQVQGCNGGSGTLSEVRFRVEKDGASTPDAAARRLSSTAFVALNAMGDVAHAEKPRDYNNDPIYFDPVMTVADAWDVADGLYLCIKNNNSEFLWVNDNFAKLVGSTKEALIGTRDSRAEHVAADQRTLQSGVPLLNYHETIQVPTADGSMEDIEIVTQKGLLREKGGSRIIGITVAFHKLFPDPVAEAQSLITDLSMKPTGIGGYIAAGPSSDITLSHEALPTRFVEDAKAYSSNYFLLSQGEALQLHALSQDEQWFFHRGNSIALHIFDATTGSYHNVTLGNNRGDVLQFSVPHNTWFGGLVDGEGYALASCSLAPGWEPSDSFLADAKQVASLQAQFPAQAALLASLAHH
eukprot:gene12035-8594_t